jgi:hypothetical protein
MKIDKETTKFLILNNVKTKETINYIPQVKDFALGYLIQNNKDCSEYTVICDVKENININEYEIVGNRLGFGAVKEEGKTVTAVSLGKTGFDVPVQEAEYDYERIVEYIQNHKDELKFKEEFCGWYISGIGEKCMKLSHDFEEEFISWDDFKANNLTLKLICDFVSEKINFSDKENSQKMETKINISKNDEEIEAYINFDNETGIFYSDKNNTCSSNINELNISTDFKIELEILDVRSWMYDCIPYCLSRNTGILFEFDSGYFYEQIEKYNLLREWDLIKESHGGDLPAWENGIITEENILREYEDLK